MICPLCRQEVEQHHVPWCIAFRSCLLFTYRGNEYCLRDDVSLVEGGMFFQGNNGNILYYYNDQFVTITHDEFKAIVQEQRIWYYHEVKDLREDWDAVKDAEVRVFGKTHKVGTWPTLWREE